MFHELSENREAGGNPARDRHCEGLHQAHSQETCLFGHSRELGKGNPRRRRYIGVRGLKVWHSARKSCFIRLRVGHFLLKKLEVGKLKETIRKDGKELRLGFTTGTCAALAAKAAATTLLSGTPCREAELLTPKGIRVAVPVVDMRLEEAAASCAVRKDAGDDPDVTDGILVYAEVRKTAGGQIVIDGGEGVGRVTRRGLDQPVGAAAINRVPRRMIEEAVAAVCEAYGYDGGLSVLITIPQGRALAERTFNPQLGIKGGLSVIGTTGIVEPMSAQALIDTIGTEMAVLAAEGAKDILLTPGNYGESFLAQNPHLALRPVVKCSNFIGEALDLAAQHGFRSVLLVGHVGKLVKLAGGVMDTHSKVADTRIEHLALHAVLAGGDAALAREVLACVTADEALDLLQAAGLKEPAMAALQARADGYLARRAGGMFTAGTAMFSFVHGLLGVSPAGEEILEGWRKDGR